VKSTDGKFDTSAIAPFQQPQGHHRAASTARSGRSGASPSRHGPEADAPPYYCKNNTKTRSFDAIICSMSKFISNFAGV